jgi:hypothetical protein
VIISASYKTDIPAFYGDWFMNRLDAGYCEMVNPYGGQVCRVSLERDDVDGFVFWTKNLGPFLDKLDEVHRRGYPFVVQYSINGYPRALEYSVVEAERSVEHLRQIADRYGPRVAVWRYDPIVFTSITPADVHRQTFERLARSLAGSTDEVVISFAHVYQKTRRNMDRAATAHGFSWENPDESTKRALAADLVQIASAHGLQLSVCSQRQYVVEGARPARCVDAARLSDVAGRDIAAPLKGNRADCACHLSRDIGAYDTCPHGCVYCYAVSSRAVAKKRHQAHDPNGILLTSPGLRYIYT